MNRVWPVLWYGNASGELGLLVWELEEEVLWRLRGG